MLKRKPKSKELIIEQKKSQERRNEFFLYIWSKRKHYCQSCSKYLGFEAKTYHFDHLLEKSKYKHLEFEEGNILLVCFECHEKKSIGHPTENHQKAINIAKNKYGIS